MGFDLSKYELVEDRLARFWENHPQGRIATELVHHDDNRVVMAAYIFDTREDVCPTSTGFAEEIRGSTPVNKTSPLENCETSAIGRALANRGYAPKGARPSREEMQKVKSGETTTETTDIGRSPVAQAATHMQETLKMKGPDARVVWKAALKMEGSPESACDAILAFQDAKALQNAYTPVLEGKELQTATLEVVEGGEK